MAQQIDEIPQTYEFSSARGLLPSVHHHLTQVGRVDIPWGVFLKSNLGTGRFNKGKMNNEDWIPHKGRSYQKHP